MSGEIRQYIRRNRKGKKNTKVGLLLARRINGEPIILWSLCRPDDKFDVNEAVKVAEEGYVDRFQRAVPPGIVKDWDRFAERATRYFKTKKNLWLLSD